MPHPCMNCETSDMVLATQDVTVTYKSLSANVPAVAGWHCPHCGEIEFIDEASSRRHMDALSQLLAEHQEQTRHAIKSTRES